jgi:hypothetical protein
VIRCGPPDLQIERRRLGDRNRGFKNESFLASALFVPLAKTTRLTVKIKSLYRHDTRIFFANQDDVIE